MEHRLPLHTEVTIEVYHEQVPAKANVVGLAFVVRLCWEKLPRQPFLVLTEQLVELLVTLFGFRTFMGHQDQGCERLDDVSIWISLRLLVDLLK